MGILRSNEEHVVVDCATTAVGKNAKEEYGLSQIFIAIDPNHFNTKEGTDILIEEVLSDIKSSELAQPDKEMRYPGESSMKIRRDNWRTKFQ